MQGLYEAFKEAKVNNIHSINTVNKITQRVKDALNADAKLLLKQSKEMKALILTMKQERKDFGKAAISYIAYLEQMLLERGVKNPTLPKDK